MPFDLVETSYLLLLERVPPTYDFPSARPICRELAKRFAEEDPWARNLKGAPEDMSKLRSRLVSWVRAERYEICDEPPPPYGVPKGEFKGTWRPQGEEK